LLRYPEQIERILNSDRIVVMGSAPRHLRLGYPGHETAAQTCPNVPVDASDSQTILIAKMLGADHIGYVKRTDGIYSFDPYTGFDQNLESWRFCQSRNQLLDSLSYEQFLDPTIVSNIGAGDKAPGHLLETSAARLADRFDMSIGIVHIDPIELYPHGRHIVTGQPWPKGQTSREVRERTIDEVIAREKIEFYPSKFDIQSESLAA